MTTTDAETVPTEYQCPTCGENRIDWLVWDEETETVVCATCQTRYVP